MEDERKEFGGAIPVENVQELASHRLKDIPHRYIRPELELDAVTVEQHLETIPVIDMMKLCDDQESPGYDQEMAPLHHACKNWGFFQLINHGAAKVIEEMKAVVMEFFKLPLEEKMACAQTRNTIEGYGQAFVVSEEQKLDWGDMLFIASLPAHLRNMRFWPETPSNFRETLHEYSKELQKKATELLSRMAVNLGIEPQALTSAYKDGNQGIRMNYYPPCAHADKVVGLTPHSDATGLMLLVQINEVDGLQIRKDSQWLQIQPISGAIIVNIGDILEIMSNGEYRSIEHRAVVDFKKERLSMAAFHSPSMSVEIRPLEDAVRISGEEKYKRLGHEEYLRLVIASKLDGKNLLHQLKVGH